MSDEKLRLQAYVQDNMSPALRKIKDTLNSIHQSPGMMAATDGIRKLGLETQKFATFGGSAATAMGALGIGGLAAAGSLAGVVEQMKALGQRSLDLKELARETGVSSNWLNVWSHAGLHFGVSADAMQSSLNHLTSQMPEFQRHMGGLYNLMAQRWPDLTKKLLGEDTEHQVQDITSLLQKLQNQPQLQKRLASEFFGNGDEVEKLFKNGADGFWKEFSRQQKLLNPINPDLLKQAQAFKDAQIGFNDALQNFENSAGPTFLKGMTQAVDKATEFVKLLKGPDSNGGWKEWAEKMYGFTPMGLRDKLEDKIVGEFEKKFEGHGADAAPKKDSGARAVQGQQELQKQPPQNPLFHKSAFISGGEARSYFGLTGIIEAGTKSGVLAAFRELMADRAAASPDGKPKFTKADFETGGGSSAGSGAGDYGGGAGSYGGRAFPGFRSHGSSSGDDSSGGGGQGGGDMLGQDSPTGAARLRASKGMAGRAKETYDFWRKQGFSRNAALGFVGNEQGEGTLGDGKTHLHWDVSHYSGGIVQWDPNRRAAIMKATGIDVWHDKNHQHQLEAEAWELKNKYPKLYGQLRKGGVSIGQATHGLVHHYELPANQEYQSRLRGAYGAGWASRLKDSNTQSARGAPEGGHIRADIHVHGNAHKATAKATGRIEAKLHRWPKMEEA